MLLLAIASLVVAALIGLFLAARFFSKQELPLEAAILHGMFGEAGLILVAIKAYNHHFMGVLVWALILLAIAAVGGLTLVLFFHLKGKKLPVGLVLGHAGIGVVAFLILVAKALVKA